MHERGALRCAGGLALGRSEAGFSPKAAIELTATRVAKLKNQSVGE
jgi:hypothetical protein